MELKHDTVKRDGKTGTDTKPSSFKGKLATTVLTATLVGGISCANSPGANTIKVPSVDSGASEAKEAIDAEKGEASKGIDGGEIDSVGSVDVSSTADGPACTVLGGYTVCNGPTGPVVVDAAVADGPAAADSAPATTDGPISVVDGAPTATMPTAVDASTAVADATSEASSGCQATSGAGYKGYINTQPVTFGNLTFVFQGTTYSDAGTPAYNVGVSCGNGPVTTVSLKDGANTVNIGGDSVSINVVEGGKGEIFVNASS